MADENTGVRQGAGGKAGPIVVAVDFTPDSEAALVWACTYAGRVGAEVVVLHVVHDPADAPGYYRKGEADLLRPMEDVAEEYMGQFLERVAQDNPGLTGLEGVERALVKGIPATRILEVAQSRGASLIVMGSQGRTGLPHLLLGSKAQRVVQMSPIPVTIVKAGSNDD